MEKINLKIKYPSYLILGLLVLLSCDGFRNNNLTNKASEPKITIHRYEQALFSLNADKLEDEIKIIQKEYNFFIGDNADDEKKIEQLYQYLTDPVIKEIFSESQTRFPNLNDIEEGITDAFSNIEKYYPDFSHPSVYTYISGLDYTGSVIYVDTVLIIPIDMYLGKGFELYIKSGIPEYVRMRLNKEYLLRDCIYQIAKSNISDSASQTVNLLDLMIEKGKILFFIETVLPDISDEILMGYNNEQIEWCKSNESNLWAFMINNKLLFTTEFSSLAKFIDDAPFTSVISQQAPGRLGHWIGWQIVKAYMKNNSAVTLQKLMKIHNSQEILNKSRYKP